MARFAVDFEGYIKVEAKSNEEAENIFWEWVGDMQDMTLTDWRKVIIKTPYFESDGSEEI